MKKYNTLFELSLDDDAIEWVKSYGEDFKPKSKAAYKNLLIAYFEFLKARYEDDRLSEPQQAEDGKETRAQDAAQELSERLRGIESISENVIVHYAV